MAKLPRLSLKAAGFSFANSLDYDSLMSFAAAGCDKIHRENHVSDTVSGTAEVSKKAAKVNVGPKPAKKSKRKSKDEKWDFTGKVLAISTGTPESQMEVTVGHRKKSKTFLIDGSNPARSSVFVSLLTAAMVANAKVRLKTVVGAAGLSNIVEAQLRR